MNSAEINMGGLQYFESNREDIPRANSFFPLVILPSSFRSLEFYLGYDV
jgi:hypothetical protein